MKIWCAVMQWFYYQSIAIHEIRGLRLFQETVDKESLYFNKYWEDMKRFLFYQNYTISWLLIRLKYAPAILIRHAADVCKCMYASSQTFLRDLPTVPSNLSSTFFNWICDGTFCSNIKLDSFTKYIQIRKCHEMQLVCTMCLQHTDEVWGGIGLDKWGDWIFHWKGTKTIVKLQG